MNKTKYYQEKIEKYQEKMPFIKNFFLAFLFGGIIALIGQGLIELYEIWFNQQEARSVMLVTLIFISSLLTGLGVYDIIGQYGKAGTIIPITGFANSMSSAALEAKQEGVVLGIGTNLFKLAGSVITFGVVFAYIFGIIRYLIKI